MVLVFWILHLFDSIRNTVTPFSKNVNVLVKYHIISVKIMTWFRFLGSNLI